MEVRFPAVIQWLLLSTNSNLSMFYEGLWRDQSGLYVVKLETNISCFEILKYPLLHSGGFKNFRKQTR